MVLFKCAFVDNETDRERIYIPIWFYSNDAEYIFYPSEVWFTFQYGSIQIAKSIYQCSVLLIYIPIWFYSNSLIIWRNVSTICIYIPIWFYSNELLARVIEAEAGFTFQYGSIQITFLSIDRKQWNNLHSNMVLFKSNIHSQEPRWMEFTFQYGSIQIGQSDSTSICWYIYIPIWFYSNRGTASDTCAHPINLHSNMVLFKF